MENQRGMGRLRAGAPFSIPFIFLLLAWSEVWAGAPAPAPAVTTSGPHRPEHQIANLEQVFSEIGKDPERQECMGSMGLVDEATKMIEEAGTPEIRDAIIAGAAAKAEHYEMVSYADLIDGAEMMKKRQAVNLLTKNRNQEVATARKLERISPRLGKAAA